jgi:hypothetical protein
VSTQRERRTLSRLLVSRQRGAGAEGTASNDEQGNGERLGSWHTPGPAARMVRCERGGPTLCPAGCRSQAPRSR